MNTHYVNIIAATLLISTVGCACGSGKKGLARTTPLQVQGPVTVSGPVSVTGPVTVSGGIQGTDAWGGTTPAGQTSRGFVRSAPSAPAATSVSSAPRNETVTTTTAASQELELKKEEATVDKNTVSNGAAVIRKRVVSEDVSIPVTLRREDFTVERVPADGSPTTPWGEGQSEIVIPLTRETAEVVITPRVIEVLRVRKTVDTETRTLNATVRTEQAEVVRREEN